jgi:hypothetical protein
MRINLFYFIKSYGYNALPPWFFKRNYHRLKRFEQECDREVLHKRLNYYFKIDHQFDVPAAAVAVKNFRNTAGSSYYLDTKEFLHYFTPNTRFAFHFGDETHVSPYPTIFKARPIEGEIANSVLFKLNKRRHYRWVNDPLRFSEKLDALVWRGALGNESRRDFVKKFWQHPQFDVGQINHLPGDNDPGMKKNYLSIKEQLRYKFIFSLEGNDVATNLKWIMSSNSLCFMPKPRFETWFMEGLLKGGFHYVKVKDDYSDVEEKTDYYSTHIDEAEAIIENAHRYVEKFQNEDMEDLLCLKVLERYAELSGQSNARKFSKTTSSLQ